ncbi:MAG: hypothetical protein WCO60_07135 [Verrucomicrobiota bacterium]
MGHLLMLAVMRCRYFTYIIVWFAFLSSFSVRAFGAADGLLVFVKDAFVENAFATGVEYVSIAQSAVVTNVVTVSGVTKVIRNECIRANIDYRQMRAAQFAEILRENDLIPINSAIQELENLNRKFPSIRQNLMPLALSLESERANFKKGGGKYNGVWYETVALAMQNKILEQQKAEQKRIALIEAERRERERKEAQALSVALQEKARKEKADMEEKARKEKGGRISRQIKDLEAELNSVRKEYGKYGVYYDLVIQKKLSKSKFPNLSILDGGIYQARVGDELVILVTVDTMFSSTGRARVFAKVTESVGVELENGFSDKVSVLQEVRPNPVLEGKIERLRDEIINLKSQLEE